MNAAPVSVGFPIAGSAETLAGFYVGENARARIVLSANRSREPV
jgi:hypothetical protein